MPNISFISNNNSQHLLLIMAGWGMDCAPFTSLNLSSYDIAVAWDYTDETLDTNLLSPYREIIVIAWSMGVMEAERLLHSLHLPITLSVAVNGTPTPVNDTTGIPTAIFENTLKSLSPENLTRFNRRMCGSQAKLADFQLNQPNRDIQSLHRELKALGARSAPINGSMRWDLAIVGTRDMIFPPANQLAAWQNTRVLKIDEPHLVDFQKLINQLIIDKERVASRFIATREGYEHSAKVQHEVAKILSELTLKFSPKEKVIEHAIEIGAGSGNLTKLYSNKLQIKHLELWDIAPVPSNAIPHNATMVVDDAEARLGEIAENSIDLIISASTLQWFNSPLNALRHIQRILRTGGIAAISIYTLGTYRSLSSLTGTTLNYVTAQSIINSISAHCQIIYAAEDEFQAKFESTRQLIDHIRLTGVNATGSVPISTLRKLLLDNSLRTLEYNITTIIFTKE